MRILFWATAATGDSFLLSGACVEVSDGCARAARGVRRALRAGSGQRSPPPRVVSDFVRGGPCRPPYLLDDFGDHARADRAAALADGEAQAGVHGDGLNQLDLHL